MTAIGNDVDLKSQCVWFAQWSTQWLVQWSTRWKLTMGWVGPKETYKVTCHMCLVGPMVEPLKLTMGLVGPLETSPLFVSLSVHSTLSKSSLCTRPPGKMYFLKKLDFKFNATCVVMFSKLTSYRKCSIAPSLCFRV